MHLDQILEARALATPVAQTFTANDSFPAIVIQYVPALGSATTNTASFTLANDSFQFLVNGSTPSGLDVIGVSGKIDLSSGTYDTMGELVDTVNGRTAWRAYLVGALRAITCTDLLAKTSTRCDGATGTTVYIDTTDSKEHIFAISGEKFVNNGINGHVTDYDDGVENSLLFGSYLVSAGSSGVTLRYYSGKQGSTETALTSSESVTVATATQHGEENLSEPYITAKRGERLIVYLSQASNDADFGTGLVIQAIGQSAVLSGSRIVDSKNYGDA